MTFSVDLRQLPGLTNLVLRARDDVVAGAHYVATYRDLPWAPGLASGALIALVKPAHDRVVDAVETQLRRRLGNHAANVAGALTLSIEYYTDTDHRSAAKADALRPGADDPRSLTRRYDPLDPPPPLFTDVVRPTEQLVAPKDHRPEVVRSPVNWVTDPVSLSRGGRDLVWRATSLGTALGWCDRPVDIFAEILQPVLGNWPAMLQLAEVFTRTGAACAMVNQNLADNQTNIRAVWQGQAADACQEHLRLFGLCHVATQQWLNQIADCYQRIGTTVCDLNQQLGDLLVRLCDMAVAAILAAQAAQATAPTIVGGAVFGGAAMYEFYQFWQAVQAGRELAEATDLVVHGFVQELFHLAGLDTAAPITPPRLRLPEPVG